MSQDELYLSWKSFDRHVLATFQEILKDSNLSDVTLVCEDQIQIPAHKLVLSSVSPVFRNLLLNNSDLQPLIYLDGVNKQQLQSILQFIYLGKTTVLKDQVKEFMDIAEELQIKELVSDFQIEGQLFKTTDEVQQTFDEASANAEVFPEEDKIEPETRSKLSSISLELAEYEHKSNRYYCDQCEYNTTQKGHLKTHQQSIHEGTRYPCDKCEYQATTQGNLKVHQESKHEGIRHSCTQCEYEAPDKSSLRRHHQTQHNGFRFSCTQCEYKATRKDYLKAHQQSQHEGVRYSCNQCEYQAGQQKFVKAHQKSKHEGVRYYCDQCEVKTTTSGHLQRHKQAKHEGNEYFCDQCEYNTKRQDNLQSHKQAKHPQVQ